jgi:hypothetical protein
MTSAWQQPTKEEVKATLADLRAGRSRDSVELRGHSVDTSTGASDLRKRDSVDSVDSVEAWTPPAPLGRPGKLPAFPAGALPGWLASFVQALATATQTPPDLGAMLTLSVLATAAGGRVEVEARAGWREPLNLFTAVALPPGNRKSAVFAEVTKPLHDYERMAVEQLAPIIAEAALAKKVALERAEKAQAAAGKAPADRARDALIEARELAREAEEVQVPLPPRMLADDVTPEALVSLLAAYERMAILSPEGGVFQMMAGRYSQAGIGPPLDAYLKGHSGDQIRVDRKGRDPEFAQHPALTLGLAVQPDVLHSIADQPAFRGRGLLARFLYAVPESTVGRRQVGAPAIPENVRSHYHGEMRALCASLAELAEPAGVAFGAKADRLLLDFEADLEPRLGEDGDLGHIADWGSKLAGAVVRIAGLLHLAEHLREGWARPVEDETVIASIEIAEYLIQHALTVFDAMGADPALSDARYVLSHLERHPRECFTIRDLHVALPRGRFAKVANLEPALAVLQVHGYIRPQPPKETMGPGRKPSPAYDVNPLGPPQNPQNPQNPVSAGQSPSGEVPQNPGESPQNSEAAA